MKNEKKKNGSYYTPKYLTDFIIDYIIKKTNCKESINILEPSSGDGAFIRAIFENEAIDCFKEIEIVLVEKDSAELLKTLQIPQKTKNTHTKLHPYNQDFLDFLNINTRKYSLIVGNPPYIKKNYLTVQQIEMCGKIHLKAGLSKNKVKNIWTAFLVGCVSCLSDDGILAFVLPAEFLQVKFATEIRDFLYKEFERIEVFTFNQLLFECKGQETVLVIGFKKSDEKNVFYADIQDIKSLRDRNFSLKPNVSIQATSTKWTHHYLCADELDLIYKLKSEFKPVKKYCISKAGIVTAANKYFIVTAETVKEFGLQPFIKPIVQKSIFVNGSVVFRKKDFNFLVRTDKPSFLLSLENLNEEEIKKISDYLNIGIRERIDKRYKCLKRKHWFEVPNIGAPPAGFFFKRSHRYPKLLKNDTDALVTDSAYKIEMNENYNIDGLVYSFYNSLTIVFAELQGRYYGGGVLELTPNEFKELPLPYVEIESTEFKEYVEISEALNDRSKLIDKNDKNILHSYKGVNLRIINRLSKIRNKLMARRMRIPKK